MVLVLQELVQEHPQPELEGMLLLDQIPGVSEGPVLFPTAAVLKNQFGYNQRNQAVLEHAKARSDVLHYI